MRDKNQFPSSFQMNRGQVTIKRGKEGGAHWASAGAAPLWQMSSFVGTWEARERTRHIHFAIVLREGWRNSLDWLGLIREKQTKLADIVRLRALDWVGSNTSYPGCNNI